VRPRRSRFAVVVVGALLALTIAAVWDWEYGTGFSLRDVFTKLGNENPVLSAIPDTELSQLWSANTRAAFVETLRVAVLGTVSGAIVALPLALRSTRIGAPNRIARTTVRTTSNVVRALPEVLWALLLVAALSTGNLPGLIALFLFTIAVVTKLTADTIDGIDLGPLEAASASGARHTQMLRTAVVPQILPAYASYVLYSFELNLRGSAVLGLVGAGGIGARIDLFKDTLAWERLWAIVVMFVIVVFIVDRLSTYLRRRLV
jgi:phosphonate transport system permease protein